MKFVVIARWSTGFHIIGPFESRDEAQDWSTQQMLKGRFDHLIFEIRQMVDRDDLGRSLESNSELSS